MARTTTGEGKPTPTQPDAGKPETQPGQQGGETKEREGVTTPRETDLAQREAALAELSRKVDQRAQELEASIARFEERMRSASRSLEERDESPMFAANRYRTGRTDDHTVGETSPDGPTVLVLNQRAAPTTLYPRTEGPVPSALVLKPGGNIVPAGLWEAAKAHPHVRKLLELGEDPHGTEGLREMAGATSSQVENVGDALLLVRSLTSTDDLERVLAGEQRAQVKAAAEKQKKKVAEVEARARG